MKKVAIANSALFPLVKNDRVSLWYNCKFRCGRVVRCEPQHILVNTEEGCRFFKYDKICDMYLILN